MRPLAVKPAPTPGVGAPAGVTTGSRTPDLQIHSLACTRLSLQYTMATVPGEGVEPPTNAV